MVSFSTLGRFMFLEKLFTDCFRFFRLLLWLRLLVGPSYMLILWEVGGNTMAVFSRLVSLLIFCGPSNVKGDIVP